MNRKVKIILDIVLSVKKIDTIKFLSSENIE